jgi:hypothetical protein
MKRKDDAEGRRRILCDAAIQLLADEGAKRLTHRKWSDRQGCVVGAANDGFPYDARARSGPRAEGKKHAYTCWEPD